MQLNVLYDSTIIVKSAPAQELPLNASCALITNCPKASIVSSVCVVLYFGTFAELTIVSQILYSILFAISVATSASKSSKEILSLSKTSLLTFKTPPTVSMLMVSVTGFLILSYCKDAPGAKSFASPRRSRFIASSKLMFCLK